MEVKTLTMEKFDDINLKSESAETCGMNSKVDDEAEIDNLEANKTQKSNSLSKFFRLRGAPSLAIMDESKPSKTRSFFGLFGKKSKKSVEEVAPDSESAAQLKTEKSSGTLQARRTISVRSLVNSQILPWIGIRRSQANLHDPPSDPAKSDNEEELHEIATRSEIF